MESQMPEVEASSRKTERASKGGSKRRDIVQAGLLTPPSDQFTKASEPGPFRALRLYYPAIMAGTLQFDSLDFQTMSALKMREGLLETPYPMLTSGVPITLGKLNQLVRETDHIWLEKQPEALKLAIETMLPIEPNAGSREVPAQEQANGAAADPNPQVGRRKSRLWQEAERALDSAGIVDDSVRQGSLKLIGLFEDVLDKNRKRQPALLVSRVANITGHIHTETPSTFRVLLEHETEVTSGRLPFSKLDRRTKANLVTRQWMYEKAHNALPADQRLHCTAMVTVGKIKRLVKPSDNRWLEDQPPDIRSSIQDLLKNSEEAVPVPALVKTMETKKTLNETPLAAVRGARRKGSLIQHLLMDRSDEIRAGSLHLRHVNAVIGKELTRRQAKHQRVHGVLPQAHLLATGPITFEKLARLTTEEERRWMTAQGLDATIKPVGPLPARAQVNCAADVPGNSSQASHAGEGVDKAVELVEPLTFKLLRVCRDELRAGSLQLRDLDEKARNNLLMRQFVLERRQGGPFDEAKRLSSSKVLTTALVEQFISKRDRGWRANHAGQFAKAANSDPSLSVPPFSPAYLAQLSRKPEASPEPATPAGTEARETHRQPGAVVRLTASQPAVTMARRTVLPPLEPMVVPRQYKTVAPRLPSNRPESSAAGPTGFTMLAAGVASGQAVSSGEGNPANSFYRPFRLRRDAGGMDVFQHMLTEPAFAKMLERGVSLAAFQHKDPEAADAWLHKADSVRPFLRAYSDDPGPREPDESGFEGFAIGSKANLPQPKASTPVLEARDVQFFAKLADDLDNRPITLRTVERLRNASRFIEEFSGHPIASATDPKDREEALRQASKFPRTGTSAARGAKAGDLFEAHWRRPILLKVLRLGDFKRHDPVGYGVLSRTREHGLFNRLNEVMIASQAALPSRPAANAGGGNAPA